MGRAGFGRRRVVGGAVVIFIGAILISAASTSEAAHGSALHGIAAAVGAGLMFGTMYIPYRKAYITGMNPLTFLTFFTFGEMTMMTAVALLFTGGVGPFWRELVANRAVLLWPMLGGFMWVVGDLFQNYAAKYVGISRGIPLSNTNQLWGLLLGLLVFRELRGLSANTYAEVIGGSVMMALGALAISTSSTSEGEYASWKRAAGRETELYGIDPEYVTARMEGRDVNAGQVRRTLARLAADCRCDTDFRGIGGTRTGAPHGDSDRVAGAVRGSTGGGAGSRGRGAVARDKVQLTAIVTSRPGRNMLCIPAEMTS